MTLKNKRAQESEETDETNATNLATDISTCATQASSIDTLSNESDIFNKYKSKASIFSAATTDNQKVSESEFLKTVKKVEVEEPKKVAPPEYKFKFKERGMLYKFDEKEWVNLGEGTIMILEDGTQNRLVFSRGGVNITAFDFWINFDIQPQASGKAVKFFVPECSSGGPKLVFHALRLVNESRANLFFETLKESIPA